MSDSLVTALPSPLENGELSPGLLAALLQPSIRPPTLPAAHRTGPNPPERLPEEPIARRRSTRVSIAPKRFRPEVDIKKPSSTPPASLEDGPPETLQDTATVPRAQDIMGAETTHSNKISISVEESTKEDMTNATSDRIGRDSIKPQKISLSEDLYTRKRLRKRPKPEGHKYLAPAPTARKTRSQNTLNSTFTDFPTEPLVSETVTLKAPALEGPTRPRLSNMIYRSPLRAMVKSATLHYRILPTYLSDQLAIASLYRTFFAIDIYQKQLKALGLEGDDEDVREAMKQVWEIVHNGEKDDEVVWKMLTATWGPLVSE